MRRVRNLFYRMKEPQRKMHILETTLVTAYFDESRFLILLTRKIMEVYLLAPDYILKSVFSKGIESMLKLEKPNPVARERLTEVGLDQLLI